MLVGNKFLITITSKITKLIGQFCEFTAGFTRYLTPPPSRKHIVNHPEIKSVNSHTETHIPTIRPRGPDIISLVIYLIMNITFFYLFAICMRSYNDRVRVTIQKDIRIINIIKLGNNASIINYMNYFIIMPQA